MLPAPATFLVLIVLVAGCASPAAPLPQPEIHSPETGPGNRVEAPRTPIPAPSDEPPGPVSAAPATDANETALPVRPWIELSLASGAAGAVASFLWQTPDDLPVAERDAGVLELDVNATPGLTAWAVQYVPAGRPTAEVTAQLVSLGYDRSYRTLLNGNLDTYVPPSPSWGGRLTTGVNWTESPEGWIILAASGPGGLTVAVRSMPSVDSYEDRPRIAVPPAVQAEGAWFGLYSAFGSGTNVGELHVETRQSPGVDVINLAHTDPVLQAGEVVLEWHAAAGRWASVQWGTQDNLGASVTAYQVHVAGLNLTGADTTHPAQGVDPTRPGTVIGALGPGPSFTHVVTGDGPEVDVVLAYTLANAGDWRIGFWFEGMAFGASLMDLTGMPGVAVDQGGGL